MTSTLRQPLPPCCHAVHPGHKDTTKVRFKTELSKVAVAAKQESFARLAGALTEARSALNLDHSALGGSSSGDKPSVFSSVEDIQAYTSRVVSYLSLVKGFSTPPPPPAAQAPTNAVSYAPVDATTPTSALRQPLIDDHSPLNNGVTPGAETSARAFGSDCTATYSTHLSFCVWRDALTGAQLHALNARLEYAQVLLASGLFMMNDAREKVDALLASRLSELDETQLKLAYQLFLSAAGVFDACLESISVPPRTVGAEVTDLSTATPEPEPAASVNDGAPDADMMEKWRAEQRKAVGADAAATSEHAANAATSTSAVEAAVPARDDLAMLERVPDLAHGRFPQLLAWVALAEAQELVILRGMSRDFVDFSLMAKLSMDLANRYRESHAFAAQTLPCTTSPVADKLRLFTNFKASYYGAVSSYFQGAACMAKDDAVSCAQAIANLKSAKLLMQQVQLRRQRYEDKIKQQKEPRERVDTFRAIYVRTPQIVDRDLDIMTHRNDSVYYERIPEPEAPCDALSLVRATEFPHVDMHELWRDPDVAVCLKPVSAPATAAARTDAARPAAAPNAAPVPPRQSCCESCVVS